MEEGQVVVVDGWLQTMKERNPSVIEKLQKCLVPGHFDDGAKIRNTRVVVRDERFYGTATRLGGPRMRTRPRGTRADPHEGRTDPHEIYMRPGRAFK